MTRVWRMTAALVAAVVVLVGVALPPARLAPAAGDGDASIPGAFHVHTNRSDGRSSPDEVAEAAARAGLRFLVFTDHGDGTRPPDAPTYRSGVLCLDGVEISTDEGHLIALGIPAAPYPLAGEGRDVLADVHRLGGVGVVAHPDSPRDSLQWRDWDLPIDGLELVNLDTAWRRQIASGGWRMAVRVARSLSSYLIRPSEAMAALVTESDPLAARWAALAATRPVAMFAGVDAHARLALGSRDPDDTGWVLTFPSYETIFRTLTMRVRLGQPLSGDAAADGEALLDALRRGRAYAALDGVFSPPAFELGANGVGVGESVVAAGPVRLTLKTNAPSTFTTTVWRNGEVLAQQPASADATIEAPAGDAFYWAEIRATDREPAPPWLMSNGVSVRSVEASALRVPPAETAWAKANPTRALFDARTDIGWMTEQAPNSRVAVDVSPTVVGRELHVRFGLPGGDVYDQFAALVASLGDTGFAGARGLRFTARSESPMRLSVQLRVPGTGDGLRWRRSVYLDAEPRVIAIPFDDFRPVAGATPREPPLGNVRTLLFVIDQINTRPGTSGHVWLRDILLF